jgi:hypothetical protein
MSGRNRFVILFACWLSVGGACDEGADARDSDLGSDADGDADGDGDGDTDGDTDGDADGDADTDADSETETVSTLDVGLLGHWPLGATTEDLSVYGNEATMHGCEPGEDRHGDPTGATHFDGVYDWVEVVDGEWGISVIDALSFSVWILQEGLDGNILSCYSMSDGFFLMQDDEYWAFHVEGSAITFEHFETPGVWHHIVAAAAGDGCSIWIDGIKVINGYYCNANGGIEWAVSPITIGGDGALFHGLIDDVRIYERVLTNSEIQELHAE